MKNLPIVAIIGQTNAGKSTLLNRFARRNLAITAREEGTTRDNVVANIDNRFLMVDTAGLKDPADDFEASIQDQITDAISAADLILVLIDGTKYPDNQTTRIVRLAQKSKKPYLIVLNKSDLRETLLDHEFRHFGAKQLLRISATTGQGINELKVSITNNLEEFRISPVKKSDPPTKRAQTRASRTVRSHDEDLATRPVTTGARSVSEVPSSSTLRLALIGRPNVGKSSLFNSLGSKQQAIVSSRQGTTRDINRVGVKYKGQTLEILDTAGLRKPGKREVGIEKFSVIRTLAAIEEADICCLLIDSAEPHAKLDQSIAGQIIDAGKGIILVVTKSDQLNSSEHVREQTRSSKDSVDHLLSQLSQDFNFIPYAPVVLTSSTTGKNVTKIFELAIQIDQERKTTLKTSDLNKILTDATLSHPPAGLKNTMPKLRYITQTDTCPPWFVVYGSSLQQLHWSYKRFLERKIREAHPFIGTPIKFSFKNRD